MSQGAGKTFVDQKESGALLSDDMDKTLLTKVKDVSVVEDNITNIKEAYAAAKDYLKYLEGVAATARQHMSQIDKVEPPPPPMPAFVSAASSEPKEAAALRSEGIAEAERRLKEIDRSVNLTRGYLAYMQEVADTVKTYVDQEGSGVPSSIDTDRLPLKVDNLSEAKDYLAIIKAACAAAEEYQKYLEGVAAAVRQQVIRTDKITKEEPAPPSVPALSEQAEAAALRSQDIAEGQRRKDEIEGAVNLTRGYLTYMEEVAGAGKTFVDQKESGALLSDDMDKTLLTKVKDVSVVEDNITNIKEAYAAAKDYLKYLEGVAATARQHMSQIDKVEPPPPPMPAFVSAASSEPKEAAALRSEGIAEAERRLKEIDRSVNLTRGYLAYMQEVADTVKTYVDQEGSGVPSSIDTDRLPLKVDNLSEAKDYLAIIKAAYAAAEEYQKYLEGVAAAVRQQVIRTDKITKEEPAPPSVPAQVSAALSERAEAAALRSQDIAEVQRRKDEIEGAVNLTRGYLTCVEEVAGADKNCVHQESGAPPAVDLDRPSLTKVMDVMEAKDYLANIKSAYTASEGYLKYLEGVATAVHQYVCQKKSAEHETEVETHIAFREHLSQLESVTINEQDVEAKAQLACPECFSQMENVTRADQETELKTRMHLSELEELEAKTHVVDREYLIQMKIATIEDQETDLKAHVDLAELEETVHAAKDYLNHLKRVSKGVKNFITDPMKSTSGLSPMNGFAVSPSKKIPAVSPVMSTLPVRTSSHPAPAAPQEGDRYVGNPSAGIPCQMGGSGMQSYLDSLSFGVASRPSGEAIQSSMDRMLAIPQSVLASIPAAAPKPTTAAPQPAPDLSNSSSKNKSVLDNFSSTSTAARGIDQSVYSDTIKRSYSFPIGIGAAQESSAESLRASSSSVSRKRSAPCRYSGSLEKDMEAPRMDPLYDNSNIKVSEIYSLTGGLSPGMNHFLSLLFLVTGAMFQWWQTSPEQVLEFLRETNVIPVEKMETFPHIVEEIVPSMPPPVAPETVLSPAPGQDLDYWAF